MFLKFLQSLFGHAQSPSTSRCPPIELLENRRLLSTLTPLKDITPGPFHTTFPLSRSVAHDGTLFFDTGTQFIATDGTSADTLVLPLHVSGIKVFRDTVFVATHGGLYVSDGTERGTHHFRARGLSSRTKIQGIAIAGNQLYFIAGSSLWVSDGTPKGTRPVPGAPQVFPQSLFAIKNTLFFRGTTPDTGLELWRTDGTRRGTRLVLDSVPGPAIGTARAVSSFKGNAVFFTQEENQHAFWKYDLDSQSLKKVFTYSGPTPLLAVTSQLFSIGKTIYFQADDDPSNVGYRLWQTDGTRSGTGPAKFPSGLRPFVSVSSFELTPDRLFFIAGDSADPRLRRVRIWAADGNRIRPIYTFAPDEQATNLLHLQSVGPHLYHPIYRGPPHPDVPESIAIARVTDPIPRELIIYKGQSPQFSISVLGQLGDSLIIGLPTPVKFNGKIIEAQVWKLTLDSDPTPIIVHEARGQNP